MKNISNKVIEIAINIYNDPLLQYIPPSAGTLPKRQIILPNSLIKNTRGYIEKIACQINGCYENGWYDACAVMMRRFIETLIIETFEHHGLTKKIKTSNNEFFYLKDLISATLNEKSWNLGRNAKKAFQNLKDVGDLSAHSRRFIAHREDIDKIQSDFRIFSQELLFLSKLK